MNEIIEAITNRDVEKIKNLVEKNGIKTKNEDGTYRATIDVLNDVAAVLKKIDSKE